MRAGPPRSFAEYWEAPLTTGWVEELPEAGRVAFGGDWPGPTARMPMRPAGRGCHEPNHQLRQ